MMCGGKVLESLEPATLKDYIWGKGWIEVTIDGMVHVMLFKSMNHVEDLLKFSCISKWCVKYVVTRTELLYKTINVFLIECI